MSQHLVTLPILIPMIGALALLLFNQASDTRRRQLSTALCVAQVLVAAWLLAFTLSLDDVVVSTFVSGPSYEILPLRIYSMVRVGLKPEVNALGTLLLVFSLVMLILSQWILLRSKR